MPFWNMPKPEKLSDEEIHEILEIYKTRNSTFDKLIEEKAKELKVQKSLEKIPTAVFQNQMNRHFADAQIKALMTMYFGDVLFDMKNGLTMEERQEIKDRMFKDIIVLQNDANQTHAKLATMEHERRLTKRLFYISTFMALTSIGFSIYVFLNS